MHRILAISLTLIFAALMLPVAASAQADAAPSPLPSPSLDPGSSSAVVSTVSTLAFSDPAWMKSTQARGPAAREDHTWTVDGDGRFAYLFGGRDGGNKAFADLWRFDLETDTWKRIKPGGKGPSARFGHSAVWVEGQGLVVFGGQRGTEFFGDLWSYDPVKDKWKLLPARGAAPKRRYGTCAIVASDGRFQISHGFTFSGRFDDTRAYNFETQRWASVAPKGRRPGERCLHDCFTTSSGEMVLYGGQDNSNAALGDLWLMRADRSWKRQPDPKAKPRRLYAVTEAAGFAYVFGGAGKKDILGDLLRFDRETLESERVDVPGPKPSARFGATLITDVIGGRLLLFGGKAKDVRADLWQLIDRTDPGVAPDVSASAEPGIIDGTDPASEEG